MRISPLALRGKAKAKLGGPAPPEKAGPGAAKLNLNKLGQQYMTQLKDRCGCLQVVCARGMNNKLLIMLVGLWKGLPFTNQTN